MLQDYQSFLQLKKRLLWIIWLEVKENKPYMYN